MENEIREFLVQLVNGRMMVVSPNKLVGDETFGKVYTVTFDIVTEQPKFKEISLQ